LLNVQPEAQRTFDGLSSTEKRGIFRHLRELLNSDDPNSLPFVEILKADKFERSRKFRVGDYRVFFAIDPVKVTEQKHTYKGTLFVLRIRNRREAY
jgi:mRNA-degrading endonuclease RelE of RelBE toxin-antitoxin system